MNTLPTVTQLDFVILVNSRLTYLNINEKVLAITNSNIIVFTGEGTLFTLVIIVNVILVWKRM